MPANELQLPPTPSGSSRCSPPLNHPRALHQPLAHSLNRFPCSPRSPESSRHCPGSVSGATPPVALGRPGPDVRTESSGPRQDGRRPRQNGRLRRLPERPTSSVREPLNRPCSLQKQPTGIPKLTDLRTCSLFVCGLGLGTEADANTIVRAPSFLHHLPAGLIFASWVARVFN